MCESTTVSAAFTLDCPKNTKQRNSIIKNRPHLFEDGFLTCVAIAFLNAAMTVFLQFKVRSADWVQRHAAISSARLVIQIPLRIMMAPMMILMISAACTMA